MYDIGRIGCLELLENGLVSAFEEALQLMEMNDEMKKKAEHGHDKEMPHDFRKDKDAMHVIIEMLKKAEAADRTGGFEENYNARLVLANHFLDVKGYHWLAEYLYKSCYRILENEDDESRRLKALQLLGLLEERRDNPDVALRYMEKAIVMANKASLSPNDPIKKELFQQLIEMYRRLGSRYFEREDDFTLAKHSKSVFYYKRAALLAKTCEFPICIAFIRKP
ncbi:hypothetical protein TNCT_637111 [Trichonephila clavata]|uniref:Tetratricopeptide repeat protein 29 n=1 Tax=Trichonephila clavata TaxID=2740835 RepID=A0A8X6H4H5_TRICU|nr:hypothetical protein TNCT_637111 [Trichonephila clavata]